MKPSAYFWTGIKLSTLLGLCGCASLMASVQYPKPIYLSLSNGQTKLLAEEKTSNFFAAYCSDGRQRKNLTLNYSFVSPKNPAGWPVNEASNYLKKVNQKRQCTNQKIFHEISEEPNCQTHLDGVDIKDLRGEPICGTDNRDESVWFLSSQKSSAEIKAILKSLSPMAKGGSYELVFVRSISGHLTGGYIFNGQTAKLYMLKQLFGDDVKSFIIPEWINLTKQFTILEPLEFQKQAYDDEIDKLPDGTENSCDIRSDYRGEAISFFKNHQWQNIWAFGIDNKGEPDPSAAINQKARIWERYISRFSKVKESTDPRSPQITNTQISLDLNGFCKYGRSLDDLTSK